jgi:hypothetical protein
MGQPVVNDLQNEIIDLIESTQSAIKMDRLWLGGSAGENGGQGVRPGGFIGQLIQTIVAYDTTEAGLITTSGVPSLLDNLNHIRYRLGQLEEGITGVTGGQDTHVHALARWQVPSGISELELPDMTYTVLGLSGNGLEIDPIEYTVSNYTTIVLDQPVVAETKFVAQYIILSE